MAKTLIVLPSYNESRNINSLIENIINQSIDNYIVVVDDNSPDNTIEVIKKFIEVKNFKNKVHLIKRKSKLGRGSAVIDGFKWGINNSENFEIFIEMDCDFSHSPDDINRGKELLTKSDFVIGARYPNGVIVNWPFKRKIFSFLANTLVRFLINKQIKDYTNGFRFYSKKSIEHLLKIKIISTGHIVLSETAAILLKENFKPMSFPITFVNRIRGKSNVNLREISRSLISILNIAWKFRFGKF